MNKTDNVYLALKRKHEKEVNDFPMVFAFDQEQFKEAMEKLGLTEHDTDKVYSIGMGGFIRKTDSESLSEMFTKHKQEMKESIDNDTTGDGFIFEMFDYELGNHEYCITWDVEPTLDALGITIEEVETSDKLLYSLKKARDAQSMDV